MESHPWVVGRQRRIKNSYSRKDAGFQRFNSVANYQEIGSSQTGTMTGGGRQEVIALPKDEALRLVQFRKDQGFPLKGEPDDVLSIRRITP